MVKARRISIISYHSIKILWTVPRRTTTGSGAHRAHRAQVTTRLDSTSLFVCWLVASTAASTHSLRSLASLLPLLPCPSSMLATRTRPHSTMGSLVRHPRFALALLLLLLVALLYLSAVHHHDNLDNLTSPLDSSSPSAELDSQINIVKEVKFRPSTSHGHGLLKPLSQRLTDSEAVYQKTLRQRRVLIKHFGPTPKGIVPYVLTSPSAAAAAAPAHILPLLFLPHPASLQARPLGLPTPSGISSPQLSTALGRSSVLVFSVMEANSSAASLASSKNQNA